MTRFMLICLVLLGVWTLSAPVAHASLKIKTVEHQGITAWYAPDPSTEIVAVAFTFEGGIVRDPQGQEGAAQMLAGLLTEGAGEYDATAFQKMLEDRAISLSFSPGRDGISGQLVYVRKYQDIALELLHLALSAPRFDDDAVARTRKQLIASITQQQTKPDWQLWRNFNDRFFGAHPYARPGFGTPESVAAISVDTLRQSAKTHFTQNHLTLTMAGALDEADAHLIMERVFARLPKTGVWGGDIARAVPDGMGEAVNVPLDIPQAFILIGYQGIGKDDDDFYAAQLLNYLLGGGGFSSLLMQYLRVENGLTYGVHSSMVNYDLADLFVIQTSTEAANREKALKAIHMVLEGVVSGETALSDDAIEDAKNYLIGSTVMSLTSTGGLAGLTHAIHDDGFSPDYLDVRADKIRAVTREALLRVAKRLLADSKPLTVIVAPPAPQ